MSGIVWDQTNSKPEAHINFGKMSAERRKMQEERERQKKGHTAGLATIY